VAVMHTSRRRPPGCSPPNARPRHRTRCTAWRAWRARPSPHGWTTTPPRSSCGRSTTPHNAASHTASSRSRRRATGRSTPHRYARAETTRHRPGTGHGGGNLAAWPGGQPTAEHGGARPAAAIGAPGRCPGFRRFPSWATRSPAPARWPPGPGQGQPARSRPGHERGRAIHARSVRAPTAGTPRRRPERAPPRPSGQRKSSAVRLPSHAEPGRSMPVASLVPLLSRED
jgi:hypothetical protein